MIFCWIQGETDITALYILQVIYDHQADCSPLMQSSDLPKKKLGAYSWYDDGFKLVIDVPLPEAVDSSQVDLKLI